MAAEREKAAAEAQRAAEEAEKSNLEWDMSNDKIKKSAIDMFTLVITKTIESSNGVKIEASPKTAQILLRRIKSLDLYALSGTTPWSDRFADVFGGTKDPDASAGSSEIERISASKEQTI